MERLKGLIKNNDLHLWVFCTGAIVLIIEVVAVRILSPYFGNTLFSISSVLSVVLLALSAGYYLGGIMADSRPSRARFYGIITASGVLVLFIELIRDGVLEFTSDQFSIALGPLISAAILFIGPAFLMGMLSPLAIKIRSDENKKMGIGKVTGGMFFWSTLGSIVGSLAAGFILIPTFGVDAIMGGIGITLVIMGLTPQFIKGLISSSKLVSVIVLSAVLLAAVFISEDATADHVLYEKDGVYEKIIITEGKYRGHQTRFLLQDTSNSGAAFLDSNELVFDYTKYYSVYEAFGISLERTLLIGGGAYSLSSSMLSEPDEPVVDVVEIEPELYELAQKYFGVEDSPRLNNHIEDGRRFLKDSEYRYDLIFSDVYKSLFSIPSHFTSIEFFELAKSKLSEDGVFVANIIGGTYRHDESFTFSQINTFRQVFPNSHFYGVASPGQDLQNIIMVGVAGDEYQEIDYRNLDKSENEILRNLQHKEIDMNRYNLRRYPIFTDDYAPVDYLIAQALPNDNQPRPSNGQISMNIIEQLLSYGPRFSGSSGNTKAADFIEAELRALVPEVTTQSWTHQGVEYSNIIGRVNPAQANRIVLATHFDSKKYANQDPDNTQSPVPGANDSASGVAALLSLVNSLNTYLPDGTTSPAQDYGIDFVFFDGEEGSEKFNQGKETYTPVGSSYFAKNIDDIYSEGKLPKAGIVIDMVCEKNASFKREANSSRWASDLQDKLWNIGSQSGVFSDSESLALVDDHAPLNSAGIPSVLIIDFDYEDFHKTSDTADKCSEVTLNSLHQTLRHFLAEYQ